MTLRIARGDSGAEVRDLRQRLAALGFPSDDGPAFFGPSTEQALRAFQAERGLRVDGVCGRHTWSALVESGFALGDRLLYYRASAMLRGDDVGELQRRLNALGFDAGREDGIFGPRTNAALREFQRNAGLSIDGIGGPATMDALQRLGHFAAGSVAGLREREMLRASRGRLAGRKVYLAVEPGLEVLGDVVSRGLALAGVDLLIHAVDADDTAMAEEANKYEADVFVGLRFGDEAGPHCDFFTGRVTRSESGYRLASVLLDELRAVLAAAPAGSDGPCPRGRSYGALRETRMPAVVVHPVAADDATALAAVSAVVHDVGAAIVRGIRRAIEEPYPG